MGAINKIITDSQVPSTCAVMDWLKANGYPECYSTNIECKNGAYGGIISSYFPTYTIDKDIKQEIMEGKHYNGMYRLRFYGAWYFYMPEVDKYYFMTI